MNEISSNHSEEILQKMCEVIGIEESDVDWESRDWFAQYTWTSKQEQDFIDWLAEFLIKNKYTKLGKKHAQHEASKIVGNIGWVTKE